MSARRPLIMGNWKMNLGAAEAAALADALAASTRRSWAGPQVAVFPSHVHLADVRARLEETPIEVGGQDCVPQAPGAVTGGTSAEQLVELGCRWVLVGHSERRQLFGETEPLLREKILAAFRVGLSPVYCLGETLEQRERGEVDAVLERQVRGALEELGRERIAALTLAYEPVWAIGTGRHAAPEDVQAAHGRLRWLLGRLTDAEVAGQVRILYGGSVKPDNVASIMACDDVDGALVGGASLDPASFEAIVHYRDTDSRPPI